MAIPTPVQTDAAGGTTSPVSKTGAAIGTADPTRILAIVITWENRITVTGVTVDGNAATQAANSINTVPAPDIGVAVYYIAWPTGTTANISVSFSGAPSGGGWWAVYSIYNATFSVGATGTSNAASVSGTATMPDQGVLVGAAVSQTTDTAFTTTGATEDQDENLGTYRHVVFCTAPVSGGSYSVTADTGATNYKTIAWAAFAPINPIIEAALRIYGSGVLKSPGRRIQKPKAVVAASGVAPVKRRAVFKRAGRVGGASAVTALRRVVYKRAGRVASALVAQWPGHSIKRTKIKPLGSGVFRSIGHAIRRVRELIGAMGLMRAPARGIRQAVGLIRITGRVTAAWRVLHERVGAVAAISGATFFNGVRLLRAAVRPAAVVLVSPKGGLLWNSAAQEVEIWSSSSKDIEPWTTVTQDAEEWSPASPSAGVWTPASKQTEPWG